MHKVKQRPKFSIRWVRGRLLSDAAVNTHSVLTPSASCVRVCRVLLQIAIILPPFFEIHLYSMHTSRTHSNYACIRVSGDEQTRFAQPPHTVSDSKAKSCRLQLLAAVYAWHARGRNRKSCYSKIGVHVCREMPTAAACCGWLRTRRWMVGYRPQER